MRKLSLFFSIVLVALTIGCSKDDEDDSEQVFYYNITISSECPYTNDTIKTSYCVSQGEYEYYLESRTVGVACQTFIIVDIFGDRIEGYSSAAGKGTIEPTCTRGGTIL